MTTPRGARSVGVAVEREPQIVQEAKQLGLRSPIYAMALRTGSRQGFLANDVTAMLLANAGGSSPWL